MDLAALAAQFGGAPVGGAAPTGAPMAAPAAPPLPAWAQQLSPQDRAKIQKDMFEEGRKRLADLQLQIAERGGVMSDLEEFGRLNRRTATGSLWQQLTPDVPALRSDDAMEMLAIQARLGPAQREPGSGASSDRDVALFLQGLASIKNPGNVNRDIREDFDRKLRSAVEKAQAMEQYLQQNGNLIGFDSQWAQRKIDEQRSKNQPSPAARPAQGQPTPTMVYNEKTGKLERKK